MCGVVAWSCVVRQAVGGSGPGMAGSDASHACIVYVQTARQTKDGGIYLLTWSPQTKRSSPFFPNTSDWRIRPT